MVSLFYHILFLIFTIYVLIRCIAYGLYEINEQKNKFGGKLVILFAIFSIIFSNIMVWNN